MKVVFGAALAVFLSTAAQAGIVVTYEDPGVQNSSANFKKDHDKFIKGVETFDEQPNGSGQSFVTDYGTGGTITGTYSNVEISQTDQYGGAGGIGNYPVTWSSEGYTLTLSGSQPLNFFGYWLSALDSGNVVDFYKNGVQIFQFDPTNVINLIHSNPAYNGNPTQNFHGQDAGEQFVFLNFYDVGGTFDTVKFSEQNSRGGYESDNHTVGYFVPPIEGHRVPTTETPEPAAFALLGLGLAGIALRRRQK